MKKLMTVMLCSFALANGALMMPTAGNCFTLKAEHGLEDFIDGRTTELCKMGLSRAEAKRAIVEVIFSEKERASTPLGDYELVLYVPHDKRGPLGSISYGEYFDRLSNEEENLIVRARKEPGLRSNFEKLILGENPEENGGIELLNQEDSGSKPEGSAAEYRQRTPEKPLAVVTPLATEERREVLTKNQADTENLKEGWVQRIRGWIVGRLGGMLPGNLGW